MRVTFGNDGTAFARGARDARLDDVAALLRFGDRPRDRDRDRDRDREESLCNISAFSL